MTAIRAALTQSRNAYPGMPDSIDGLPGLAGKLEDIRAANVDHHVRLIEAARDQGAQVIGLGELFPAPYFALCRDEMWLAMAESAADGPTVTTLREVAKARGIVIVAPIYELDPAGSRFDTAVVIDADGSHLGIYRKLHIPQGRNDAGEFHERFYYDAPAVSPGAPDPALLPVFHTAAGRIGVSICYDRHFAGVIAGLTTARPPGENAQLVFSPAVTFGAKSRRLWYQEFEVDAARHRVFLGGSNRIGKEPPWTQEYFGESHFVGPEGRLANRSPHGELIIADLDLDLLEGADPSGWTLRSDARPDLR